MTENLVIPKNRRNECISVGVGNFSIARVLSVSGRISSPSIIKPKNPIHLALKKNLLGFKVSLAFLKRSNTKCNFSSISI